MTTIDNPIPENFDERTWLILTAYNTSMTSMVIVNHQLPDDPIIYCNKAFEFLTGYSQAEILGKNCRFLQGEHRDQDARFQLKEAINKGEGCVTEILNYRRDGVPYWTEIQLSPITNNEGVITHYFAVQQNVSEKRFKDDFISIASHELKTPLTSLKASLQLLDAIKDRPQTQLSAELIGRANKSLVKIETLVHDMLTTGRFKAGDIELNKEKIKLADLINDCCPQILYGGEFHIQLTGNPNLEVCADPERISQVLINLLSNVVKFAPASKEIIVHIERCGSDAKVSVTDSGPGIPPENQALLFERYYRANHKNGQYSGMGLGLFISAGIIKKHHGQIGVQSQPGEGSTFWFTVPVD